MFKTKLQSLEIVFNSLLLKKRVSSVVKFHQSLRNKMSADVAMSKSVNYLDLNLPT
jgi:hypothetical protein